jgi:hypothetical protein
MEFDAVWRLCKLATRGFGIEGHARGETTHSKLPAFNKLTKGVREEA